MAVDKEADHLNNHLLVNNNNIVKRMTDSPNFALKYCLTSDTIAESNEFIKYDMDYELKSQTCDTENISQSKNDKQTGNLYSPTLPPSKIVYSGVHSNNINKVSSRTLFSLRTLSNHNFDTISSAQEIKKNSINSSPLNNFQLTSVQYDKENSINSSPLNRFQLTSVQYNKENKISQSGQYNISSPGIEDSELNLGCSVNGGREYEKILKEKVNLERENNDFLYNRLKKPTVKVAIPQIESKFLAAEFDSGISLKELMQKVDNQLLFEQKKLTVNPNVFTQNFDPRYGKSNLEDKLTAILNFEMNTPDNYIDTVTNDLKLKLSLLEKNKSFRTRIKNVLKSKTISDTDKKRCLIVKKIDDINKNPWCAFEEDFWEDFSTEYERDDENNSYDLENNDEEVVGTRSSYERTNKKFESFLKKENYLHSLEWNTFPSESWV